MNNLPLDDAQTQSNQNDSWAHRMHELEIGVSGPLRDDLTVVALVEVTKRAQALADGMELQGARIAAERLMNEFS